MSFFLQLVFFGLVALHIFYHRQPVNSACAVRLCRALVCKVGPVLNRPHTLPQRCRERLLKRELRLELQISDFSGAQHEHELVIPYGLFLTVEGDAISHRLLVAVFIHKPRPLSSRISIQAAQVSPDFFASSQVPGTPATRH